MLNRTAALRKSLKDEKFLRMPVAFDALTARLVESMGFPGCNVGGFATGASYAVPEPLLTRDEQLRKAEEIAKAIKIPVMVDAGAGFGEPLHVMRTVEEFARIGVAGIMLEDQQYPKRAHYHKYVEHIVTREDFRDKIKFACRQRDEIDPDFVIWARSDATRIDGLEEAVARVNIAADAGADIGMVHPRNMDEAKRAAKMSKIPLFYALSRGNRDGRPVPTSEQLVDMGYKGTGDALFLLLVSFHATRKALREMLETGQYSGMTHEDFVSARHEIENLKGLERSYAIEEETVERKPT